MWFDLIAAVVAVLLAAGAVGVVLSRRARRLLELQQAMRKRLAVTYHEAAAPPDPVDLRSPGPPGRVAVSADGLLVALGREDADYRQVLWRDVSHVAPAAKGAFVLHISRVGDITVPGSLGRQIWESVAVVGGSPS